MKQEKHIVDKYLESIEGMQEAIPHQQFYARTRARLEQSFPAAAWQLPFRPAWVLGTLAILLLMNGLMLQGRKNHPQQTVQQPANVVEFMQTYDQTLPSSY